MRKKELGRVNYESEKWNERKDSLLPKEGTPDDQKDDFCVDVLLCGGLKPRAKTAP